MPSDKTTPPETESVMSPAGGLAGLHRESTTGKDLLDYEKEASALATQLAAKGLEPPLTLGLFGEWGSGKSFFLHLLQEQVRKRAGVANAVRGVLQVTVNAWHNSHANAWSSILFRVLESLQASAPDDSGAAKPFERLESGRQSRERAQKRLGDLQRELEEAQAAERVLEDDLENLKRESEQAKYLLDVAAKPHRGTIRHLTGREQIDAFPGLDHGSLTMLRVFQATWTRPVWLSFYVVGVLMALLGWIVMRTGLDLVDIFVSDSLLRLLLLTAPLFAVYVHLVWSVLKARALRRLHDQVSTYAKEQGLRQRRLTKLEAQAGQAKSLVSRLESTIKELRNDAGNSVVAAQSVADYIAARLEEADTKAYLGLLGQLRRDFERLSSSITKGEIGGIDRVVVYIDDLDRCTAQRVIELLEACHLLLGFKGFVVVLAADPRWISRSLAAHYSAQLGDRRDIGAALDFREPNEIPKISPLDYLEKIVQIPFWLPPLDARQCGNLIRGLLNEAEQQSRLDKSARPNNEEVEFIAKLAFLLRSPRTAKRFLNTYQMIRDNTEQETLRGDGEGEYRLLATALALVHGEPALATAMMHTLDEETMNLKGWLNSLDARLPQFPDASLVWKTKGTKVKKFMSSELGDDRKAKGFEHWLRAAQRYSFLSPEGRT
jgi:hypothetical protein